MKKISFRVALSGVLSALCLIMMFAIGFFPFFVYLLPMICGLIMYMIYFECGAKTSLSSYVAVSVLSVIISPGKESALLFLTFFGYYATLKVYIDKIKAKAISWLIKLIIFNASILLSYYVIINVLGLLSITEFTGDVGRWMIWVFMAIANAVFVIYDFALRNMMLIYEYKLRKLIFKNVR